MHPSRLRRGLGLGPLILLLIVRFTLGLVYSQVVPAWESYDEDGHFAYARFLAQHHSLTLPPADPAASQIWEKFQPPLYYDLIAPAVAVFDRETSFAGPERNPYFTDGDAGVNYALHGGRLAPDERSVELALRAARAAGVAISTLSVVAVFLTARRLWPREPATFWAATILYAFWPQFMFIGAMVTNDVLITAIASVAVLLGVKLALDGFRLPQALALSVLVGAGLLTKLNGAGLIVLAAGALILSLSARRARLDRANGLRLLLGLAGLLALVAAALWALSSLNFVTGQVLQLATLRDFATNLGPGGQTSNDFIGTTLSYAFHTFLASYGWGNLESFGWLYPLWTIGALLAVAGCVAGLSRRRLWSPSHGPVHGGPPARIYGLLAVFVLTILGLALSLAIAQHNINLVPGRYLLPALPAVVMLLIGGWRALPASRKQRRVLWQLASLGLVLVAWLVPFRILAPAYGQPPPESSGKIDTPIAAIFGDGLELLGYDGTPQAVAGGNLRATLCWQALTPLASDSSLALNVVGADGQGYGKLNTYPGHGNYPTSRWAPNIPFCERYTVPIGSAIPAPALAHLKVSWRTGTDGPNLTLQSFAGQLQNDSAVSIDFKVAAPPGFVPPVANVADYRLGRQIRLTGYQAVLAGDQVRVTLRWQALDDIQNNYVVFVHLRDRPDHAYAQNDSLPVQGAYPTRLWQKGEVILDAHILDLPAGGGPTPPLALYVGMYDEGTQQRLAALDANGRELEAGQIVLADGLIFR